MNKETSAESKVKVYLLPWEAREKLASALEEKGFLNLLRSGDFCAVKIHFGEKDNHGYIRPEWIKPLLKTIQKQKVNLFLTDTNTIYVGQRSDSVHHLRLAYQHGFSWERLGIPVIISDGLRGNAYAEVAVQGKHFSHIKVANGIYYADSLFSLAHFKGHELFGFGGALKNIGMGGAPRSGKYEIHSRVVPGVRTELCKGCQLCIRWCPAKALIIRDGKIVLQKEICSGCGECILSCPENVFLIPWDESTINAQEKLVEYAQGVLTGKRSFFVNFLTFFTRVCDCYPTKGKPLLPDIGILFSHDPVAIDRASADLVNQQAGRDILREIYPQIDYSHQLVYAENRGLGTQNYELIKI